MTSNPSYEELACELLGEDVLPLAPPRWPDNEGDPVHFPGGLTDQHERELQFQVCRLTDLSPDDWPRLKEADRLVWMRLACDQKRALEPGIGESGTHDGEAHGIEAVTTALLDACQSAVWFQHHCSQNERSNSLLSIELDELARLVHASAGSVKPLTPFFVRVTQQPESFFGFVGVCHHEIAVAIVEEIVRTVYAVGDPDGPIPHWLAGKTYEQRCVRNWRKAREYVVDAAPRINEPGTLNAAVDFDRLGALVRRESILARQLQAREHRLATANEQKAGSDRTATTADETAAELSTLKHWVTTELKGKQRRVMELIVEGGGQCPLSEIAIDVQVSWEPPYDDAFNGIRKAVNSKLKKAGSTWRLERNDNRGRLARVGQK